MSERTHLQLSAGEKEDLKEGGVQRFVIKRKLQKKGPHVKGHWGRKKNGAVCFDEY